jgi:hypothetical protein
LLLDGPPLRNEAQAVIDVVLEAADALLGRVVEPVVRHADHLDVLLQEHAQGREVSHDVFVRIAHSAVEVRLSYSYFLPLNNSRGEIKNVSRKNIFLVKTKRRHA